MNCPQCGAVNSGGNFCIQCGAMLSAPTTGAPAPAGNKKSACRAFSTAEYFVFLLFGLLPVIGVILCLVWAFGRWGEPLAPFARAMLWLHGICLLLLVLLLAIWVLMLAGVPAGTF